jgi:hypothetical protein
MAHKQILAWIAYPLSCRVFPILSFGSISVAPWDGAAEHAWRIKRVSSFRLEIGPVLAGHSLYALMMLELISLSQIAPHLYALWQG